MTNALEVLADHFRDEDRALRVLAVLDRAGLQIIAKPSEQDVLDATARDVAGWIEPLLGPRQHELVHALTCRIHTGCPMSPQDLALAIQLGRLLGLPIGV